jgi:hypothetical protein
MTPHSRPSTLTGTPDPRAQAQLADGLGNRARGAGVVVHPRRLAGLEHRRVQVLPAEPLLGADGEGSTCAAPGGRDGYRAVRVIPAHRRVISVQQPPGFLGDRGEHLCRRCGMGHQRGDPP